jgi:hypothetical protein
MPDAAMVTVGGGDSEAGGTSIWIGGTEYRMRELTGSDDLLYGVRIPVYVRWLLLLAWSRRAARLLAD